MASPSTTASDLYEPAASYDGGSLPSCTVELVEPTDLDSRPVRIGFGADGISVGTDSNPFSPADGVEHSIKLAIPDADRLDWLLGKRAVGRPVDSEHQPLALPPEDEPALLTQPERWLHVPGASLSVAVCLLSCPVAAPGLTLTFTDGVCTSAALTEVTGQTGTDPSDGQIEVTANYRRWLAFRAGQIDVIELLDKGGSVAGSTPLLLCLAGLAASPEFRSYQEDLAPVASGLVSLSDVWADRSMRAWQSQQAEQTEQGA